MKEINTKEVLQILEIDTTDFYYTQNIEILNRYFEDWLLISEKEYGELKDMEYRYNSLS